MRPVDQTIFADPNRGDGHDADGVPGNCFQAVKTAILQGGPLRRPRDRVTKYRTVVPSPPSVDVPPQSRRRSATSAVYRPSSTFDSDGNEIWTTP
jgi:hypothetical protein